jgi:hypothetical protein
MTCIVARQASVPHSVESSRDETVQQSADDHAEQREEPNE